MAFEIDHIDPVIKDFYNEQVNMATMEDDMSITYSKQNFKFFSGYLLIKLVNLLKETTLKLPDDKSILFNSGFERGDTVNILLKEIYYIFDNGIKVLRFSFEKIKHKLNEIIRTNQIFNTEIRDYIIYICPFVITVVAFVGFIFLLSKIKEYKVTIQNVFFIIDPKEIEDIIIKIEDFSVKNDNYKDSDNKYALHSGKKSTKISGFGRSELSSSPNRSNKRNLIDIINSPSKDNKELKDLKAGKPPSNDSDNINNALSKQTSANAGETNEHVEIVDTKEKIMGTNENLLSNATNADLKTNAKIDFLKSKFKNTNITNSKIKEIEMMQSKISSQTPQKQEKVEKEEVVKEEYKEKTGKIIKPINILL